MIEKKKKGEGKERVYKKKELENATCCGYLLQSSIRDRPTEKGGGA